MSVKRIHVAQFFDGEHFVNDKVLSVDAVSLPITVIATKIVAIPKTISMMPPTVSPNVESGSLIAPTTGFVIGLMKKNLLFLIESGKLAGLFIINR